MSMGTLSMACGRFKFLLLPFQYLVGWEEINLVISMNLFRFVQIANYQRRSPQQKHLGINLAPVR
jgi:hypothetical protein